MLYRFGSSISVPLQVSAEIKECSSSPCVNGGTCSDGLGFFYCACVTGWTDSVCSTGKSFPSPERQRNVQKMQKSLNVPRTRARTMPHVMTVSPDSTVRVHWAGRVMCVIRVCPPLFTPCFLNLSCFFYSTEIIECASNPCQNNATCLDSFGRFDCTCTTGWTDYVCSTGAAHFFIHSQICIEILECGSNPCVNGATCVDNVGYFYCTCVPGYTDTTCATGSVFFRSFRFGKKGFVQKSTTVCRSRARITVPVLKWSTRMNVSVRSAGRALSVKLV